MVDRIWRLGKCFTEIGMNIASRSGMLPPPWRALHYPLDDMPMVALQAYIRYERRGVMLEPGKH